MIQTYKKTRKMLAAEEHLGYSLERALPHMVTKYGLTTTALKLGISKAGLGYWMLKLDIKTERIALGPGDSIEVTRSTPPLSL